MSSLDASETPYKPALPSTNPLPLSASQESQVRSHYYANVRKLCQPEVAAFAQCAKGRTFSMLWNCKAQRLAMNDCMIKHATPEEQDRAREEWFQMRIAKARRERLENEEKVRQEAEGQI